MTYAVAIPLNQLPEAQKVAVSFLARYGEPTHSLYRRYLGGFNVIRFVGKNHKPGRRVVPYQTIPVLKEVAGDRNGTMPLIPQARNDTARLTRSDVYGMVKTINNRLGPDRHLHPHLFRKAAITLGLDSGISLRDMQDFARHEDPRVTRIYDINPNRDATDPAHLIAAKLAI